MQIWLTVSSSHLLEPNPALLKSGLGVGGWLPDRKQLAYTFSHWIGHSKGDEPSLGEELAGATLAVLVETRGP